MSIAKTRRRTPPKSAPAKSSSASSAVAALCDEQSFRRRRNHSQIEAMTGLILQAVNFPTRKHRDFICALQSTNSGDAARVPHTPFKRAHLTLADLMMCDGTPETRRKAVYREIVTLRRFQRRTGVVLFDVKSGSEEEATEYVDYLTPAADAAVQRMLSSPLWKTDKPAAKREAVAWAVEQLPRCEIEEEPEGEDEEPPLAEYQEHVRKRILSELERAALKIEERGGDAELFVRQLMKDVLREQESRAKTAPARLDHSALRAMLDDERDGGKRQSRVVIQRGTVLSAPLPRRGRLWRRRDGLRRGRGGGQKCPPPLADEALVESSPSPATSEEGADKNVCPPSGNSSDSAPFPLDEPTLFSEGRPEVAAQPQTLLEAALAYARRGWPVLPLHHPDPHRGCSCIDALKCDRPGKHPRTRKGLKAASTDPAQIKRWWELYPLAGVGLVMGRKSGLVALDVDPRAGGDASLCELIERYGELPATLESVTGGGGAHLFFAHPGVSFKNSTSKVAKGLDVKTDGGYVVAAPSLHASGKRYSWRTRRSPAHLPGWLLKLLTSEKPPAPAPAKAAAPRRAAATNGAGSIIPHRSRNSQLFRLACALRGDGAGLDEIERAVFDAYEQRCVKEPEPMSDAELRKIARSATRYQPGR